jgi:transcriptional regulator with XRE-family HTH domain
LPDQHISFGAELRRIRREAGLSLGDLAQAAHYTKGYLSKIETSDRPPNADLARRCDAVLGAGGTLAAFGRTADAPCDALNPSVVDPMLEDTSDIADQLAQLSWLPVAWPDARPAATTVATHAGNGLTAAAKDPLTVDVFRGLFNQSVQLGELVSSRVVLPTVATHANTLWSLARSAPASTRSALTTLAALNATYAGWMALEADDDHAAQRWSRTATNLAELVGDANLIAYTRIREAQVAVFRDDATHVLALAAQILADERVSDRFRGIGAHREAQGHAMNGDYGSCRRALDRSTVLMPAAGPPPTFDGAMLPPMANGGSYVGGVITGWCLHDLGRPAAAAEVLDQEIVRIDGTHRRAAARFGVRRVLAHVATGEVDHACTLAHELLDTAELVDSATTRRELRRLIRALAPLHTHHPVRELTPRLAAAVRTPMISS